MSKPSPSPVVKRLEALLGCVRRPDLGPGDLDEPLIGALNEIRALSLAILARERAAAKAAAVPPSGVPAVPSARTAARAPLR